MHEYVLLCLGLVIYRRAESTMGRYDLRDIAAPVAPFPADQQLCVAERTKRIIAVWLTWAAFASYVCNGSLLRVRRTSICRSPASMILEDEPSN
jgi:hypothetical protein